MQGRVLPGIGNKDGTVKVPSPQVRPNFLHCADIGGVAGKYPTVYW
jgi:hypothetical protein